MNFLDQNPKRISALLSLVGIVTLLTIAIPYPSVDFVLLAVTLLAIGHIYLKEKLLLALLLVRPTIDHFRDITLFHVQETAVNVNAALSILVFLWALGMFAAYRKTLRSLPLIALAIPLSTLIIGSSLWSISPTATAIEAMKFINIMALFFLSYIFIREKKMSVRDLLLTIVISSVLPILFGIWQLITNNGITTIDIRGRIYGTFAHPNVFAFFLLFLLILLIQYSVLSPTAWWQKERGLRTLTFLFLGALLAFTYTRAALVGLLVFLFVIGLISYRKRLLKCVVAVTLVYLLFYPINQYLIANYNYSLQEFPIIARITSRSDEADSIAWRLALVQETAPIIAMRPLHGYGFGTFPLVWDAQRGFIHLYDDSAESHNDYLRLTLETGIISLILYIIFLASLLYLAYRRCLCSPEEKKNNIYLVGTIVMFTATSLSDNMLHHTPVMWVLWSWLGAALAVQQTNCQSPNLLE